ncbi:MAG: hypothetical protein R3F10_12770 [Lysobacteraceae bacterium]
MLACLALAPLAGARGLDTNFATNGIDILSEGGADVHAIAHLPRPDGGSAVVFAYQTVNSCPAERWCLVVERFADNGFFIGQNYTSVTANFTRVSAAAIDSQGRIVVVGSHKIGSGPDHDFRIVRLTPQGALDGSFIREVSFDVANSDWRDEALAVAIDATDRIVVAGSANTSNIGDVEFGIARLLPTGTLDPAFNNGGKRRIPYEVIPGRSFAIATAMSIDSAGRIVIGGNVLDLNLGRVRIGMARLLPSGDYDTTWCQTTCTANVYPAIHSGRSVTYFGNINDPRTHTVAALAVNGSNQVAIVGDHIHARKACAEAIRAVAANMAAHDVDGGVERGDGLHRAIQQGEQFGLRDGARRARGRRFGLIRIGIDALDQGHGLLHIAAQEQGIGLIAGHRVGIRIDADIGIAPEGLRLFGKFDGGGEIARQQQRGGGAAHLYAARQRAAVACIRRQRCRLPRRIGCALHVAACPQPLAAKHQCMSWHHPAFALFGRHVAFDADERGIQLIHFSDADGGVGTVQIGQHAGACRRGEQVRLHRIEQLQHTRVIAALQEQIGKRQLQRSLHWRITELAEQVGIGGQIEQGLRADGFPG